MGFHLVVANALWLFLPAYMANMAPVFAMKLFPMWTARIDRGREWKDGRPVLGAGKTWRGLVAGAVLGGATAGLLALTRRTGWPFDDFGWTLAGGVWFPVLIGFSLGLGALVGDAVKSFFKRRRDRKRGAPWFPWDQLDFVIGGLAFAALAASLVHAAGGTPTNWFADQFLGAQWPALAVLLVATPLLHFVVNVIGYKLKFKQVPW